MPYAAITFQQARQALAQRLYDSASLFVSDNENASYIIEALQTFNAFANFYRSEFSFNTSPNVTWYNLTTQKGTLRPITQTDAQLISSIQYHFLEPQNIAYPLVWAGSKQLGFMDILNAIQQNRDQCLSESGCTVMESLISATPGRTFLADTAIDIRRICWLPVSGFGFTANCLLSADTWAAQSFEAGFPQAGNGTPQLYLRSTEPPLSFDVDVQPAVPGQYDVLTVNGGQTLSITASTVLPVPNDWTWAIKFGAMAQLMGRGSAAADPFRAEYCMARYKQAIAAMRISPALLAGRINNVPVQVESVANADFYAANWQSLTPTQPNAIYYAGLNMIALSPQPDAGPYSVTASVLANMPLPVNNGDYLQIGRDDIQAVLDYAQHLALFKSGGAEFAASFPLYQSFMRHCMLYNSKLKALSPYLEQIDGLGRRDQQINPTFSQPAPENVEAGRGQ
jgi:hypothetical protein